MLNFWNPPLITIHLYLIDKNIYTNIEKFRFSFYFFFFYFLFEKKKKKKELFKRMAIKNIH